MDSRIYSLKDYIDFLIISKNNSILLVYSISYLQLKIIYELYNGNLYEIILIDYTFERNELIILTFFYN
jgi:hypothetical protein